MDIGDVFLDGRDEAHATNYLGNTHGGMLHLGEDFYIFYHRQTNRTSYARQACAEKLTRTDDGRFLVRTAYRGEGEPYDYGLIAIDAFLQGSTDYTPVQMLA